MLAGLLIDNAQIMVFTGFGSFLSFFVGLLAPLEKSSSQKNWLGMIGISLVPAVWVIVGGVKPAGSLAFVVAYILGAVYGFGFGRFLVWYNARNGKPGVPSRE